MRNILTCNLIDNTTGIANAKCDNSCLHIEFIIPEEVRQASFTENVYMKLVKQDGTNEIAYFRNLEVNQMNYEVSQNVFCKAGTLTFSVYTTNYTSKNFTIDITGNTCESDDVILEEEETSNVFNFNNFVDNYHSSYSVSGNNLTITSEGGWAWVEFAIDKPANGYIFSCDYTNSDATVPVEVSIYRETHAGYIYGRTSRKASGRIEFEFATLTTPFYIRIHSNNSGEQETNVVTFSNIQVKPTSLKLNKFVIRSSNEDRFKNLFNINKDIKLNNATITKYENGYTMTSTGAGSLSRVVFPVYVEKNTDYVLTFKGITHVANGSYSYVRMRTQSNGGDWLGEDVGFIKTLNMINGYELKFNSGNNTLLYVWFYLNSSTSTTVIPSFSFWDIQLEKGEKTAYMPFAAYIVESGSNENGSWVKFSDGTMECRNSVKITSVDITTSCASFYRSAEITPFGNFPQTFINIPDVTYSYDGNDSASGLRWLGKSNKVTTSNVGAFYILSPWSGTTPNCNISYIAKGNWK